MAGHSKFKNIQHRKGAQDKKRAKIFTRLVREIITAAKSGAPDPEYNPRLRLAINTARSMNVPKDRIDNAVKQASASNESDNYTEIRYEGYASGGVALIVEALTDNKNRTASEVRSAFSKHGGNLAETGSVSFMFDHVGIISYPCDNLTEDQVFEAAAEAGAYDVENDEDYFQIFTQIDNYHEALEKLSNTLGSPEEADIGWRAENIIEISDEEKAKKLLKMIDALEESDDVQKVYGNYKFIE